MADRPGRTRDTGAVNARRFPHATASRPAPVGLIVLQADETIEADFRRLVPESARVLVSRIPSSAEVTSETLASMEGRLGEAAALFPSGVELAAVAYACTSGAAEIGSDRIAEIIRSAAGTRAVTDPLSALIAACRRMNLGRLALLSPYIPEVSGTLRAALAAAGIATPVFGSFDVAEEARVARTDARSILDASDALLAGGGVDALFLSCTNLPVLDAIPALEERHGLPVLSSNTVLAWHLAEIAGFAPEAGAPGRLFRAR